MGMEVALGKYMTVMCLDFKEDDTKLNFPVTFHIFNNPGVWLQDVAKIRLLDKKKERYENKASGPERVLHSPVQTLSSCSCNQFTDSWASGERAIDEGERQGGRWKKIWAG